MAKNKKGADGRYRYRIYLGKADDGSKKFKSFYGSTEREARAAAEAYRTASREKPLYRPLPNASQMLICVAPIFRVALLHQETV